LQGHRAGAEFGGHAVATFATDRVMGVKTGLSTRTSR